jgi:hypothetical protein
MTVTQSASQNDVIFNQERTKTKLRGRNPQAKYTDWATAACRQSWCQILRVERMLRCQRNEFQRPLISVF